VHTLSGIVNTQLMKKFPVFVEPEVSSQSSQKYTIDLHPFQFVQSSSALDETWNIHFKIIFSCSEGPRLWSSGQGSWLQIQRSWFDSRRYQIFWEVVGLERGPLSLLSTIEKLLGRKSRRSGLENRECGRRDPSRWSCGTLSSAV
jgi:hypothetical protein